MRSLPPAPPAARPGGRHLSPSVVLALAVVIVCAYGGTIGCYPLSDPDEARYAEIPREMLESGDYVTPRLNYFRYFEKPPLLYWLNAATFAAVGLSEFAARLWPVVFALAGMGVACVLGRAVYDPWVGGLAAVILAAAPYYFGLSQVLTLDMPLSGLMNLALAAFWFAWARPARRRIWLAAFYVFTGLAVLTKGPVAAVLDGGIVALFLLLRGEWRALGWVLSPGGLAAFAVVVLPWFVLVSVRNPEFLHFFFVQQHLVRYLDPREHHAPVWLFVPILLGGLLPWTLFPAFAPRLLRDALRRLVRRRVSPGTLYLAVWCAVVFGFFSASESKLGTYILPMICPAAILLARFLRDVVDGAHVAVVRRVLRTVAVLAAAGLAGVLVAREILDDWRSTIVLATLVRSVPVLLVTALAAGLVLRRSLQGSLLVLALGMLVFQPLTMTARRVANSYPEIGGLIRAQAAPEDLVLGYKNYAHSITFYGRRRVVQAITDGELDFGRRLPDGAGYFLPTDDDVRRVWRSGRRVFMAVNRTEYERVAPALDPPPRQILAEKRKVLVVNFPAGSD